MQESLKQFKNTQNVYIAFKEENKTLSVLTFVNVQENNKSLLWAKEQEGYIIRKVLCNEH